MYYILQRVYEGPNPDQHLDDDAYTIETTPGRTNSSREIRLSGWLGTTNDWALYAHGAHETAEAARAAVVELLGGQYRETDAAEPYGDPDVVARFLPGSLQPWGVDQSQEWCYPLRLEITADTTDARISEIVEEARQAVADEGCALDADAAESLLQKHRAELIAERDFLPAGD